MKILNNVSIDNTLTLEELNAARVSLSGVPGIGELSWNDVDGTANLTLKGGSVVLQIGQEFHSRVYNAESFPLVPGNVVYAYGAVGGQTSVKLANASTEATSRNTIGVITEVIPPEELGFVTIMGKVRELDTSAFMPNETLYLSTIDGQLTNIRPQSPDYVVSIGWVSEVSATTGSIRLNVHAVPNADEISYNNSDSGLVATNVKSGLDELQLRKADINLLSSNITLYTTNAASDIGGYYKLVSEVSDPSYNTASVNITSGPITTANQLINSFIASPSLFVGNPGFINISTIGNIRKTSGNSTQYAEFFFRVYKRSSAGAETLVATSNTTGLIQNTNYVEFNATAILNDGTFVDTDRIVIKHFANILSGSGPIYDLEFGGITPTRTLFPVPVSVIPSGTASSVIVDTSSFNGILSGSNSTIQSALNTIDDHNHDNRYYTETEINAMLDGLSSAAVDISILDAGNYYAGVNVETALQEVGLALQNISGNAADITITDIGEYYDGANVELALQEIGEDFDAVNANKADKHYPVIIGNTIIESTNQYHLLIVKSTHPSAVPMVQLRDGDETGFDIGYEKVNGSLFFNKTVSGAYDSTILSLDSNFISYKGNAVWHAGNDGTGSGLDADLLDGQHGSYYAPLASPSLTGTPVAPTAAVGTNTTQLATTAFVNAEIANDAAAKVHTHIISDTTGLQTALDAKAPLVSPALTGTPTAPTAVAGTNTTQLATTAFVNAEIANDAAPKVHTHITSDVTDLQTALDGKEPIFTKNTAFNKNFGTTAGTVTQGNDSRLSDARTPLAHTHDDRYYTETEIDTALNLKAPLASPALTGTPTAPTATAGTNTTQIATTAFVQTGLGTKANTSHTHSISEVTSLQTSLDAKAPLASPALTGTPTAPTAAVNTNTTQVATTAFVNAEIANDAAPKVHTHTIANITDLGTTLNNYQLRSEKGQANGYASLGADGLVPSTQLPSYVDDVLEFANFAAFPATGESGKIYIALDTNKTYRWSGSIYVYITSGAVDSVAGKTGVVSLVKGDVGLSNVDNTADLVKSVASAATLTTARTINGTSFNGSENITTANWGTSRTITIGSTGKAVNGSGNVSWSLAEIGAQAAGSYAASTHSHVIGDVTGLQTALDGKQATLTAGYGDTLNPYASKIAKYFLAAPNAADGVPTFRTIVASDIPTLNQSTTGSAATLTTARTLTIGSTGKTFNGSANVSWTLAEIGAQAAGSYAASTHTHGNITNAGAIGTTANLMVKTTTSGVLTTLAAGTTAQYLRGDGSWATPPDTNTTYSAGNGISLSSTTFSVAGGNGLVQETSGLALGTPTTLTAATANALTTTSHTHAITTTASGAASTIVATDTSGNITAADTYNFGTAADIKYNSTTKSIDFIFA